MDRTDPKMRFTLPSDRQPVLQDKVIILQKACQETDDEMRWLLALISDTGMRLNEAVGLHRDDIVLDAPNTPHRPHRTSVAASEDQEQCKAYSASGNGSVGSTEAHAA